MNGRFRDAQRPDVNDWINYRLGYLWDAESWVFVRGRTLLSTVAGTQSVTPPSDLAAVRAFRRSDGTRLEWLDPDDFDDLYFGTNSAQGLPIHWTIVDDDLLVGPTPTAADSGYGMLYDKSVALLTDDNAVPAHPRGDTLRARRGRVRDRPETPKRLHLAGVRAGMERLPPEHARRLPGRHARHRRPVRTAHRLGRLNWPPVRSTPTGGLRYWRMLSGQRLRIRNFSGGLNLRDAPQELQPNESPDLWNATLDERGSATKRLGYTKANGNPFSSALVKNSFFWFSGSHRVWQVGAELYLDDAASPFYTFSTDARCGFADFKGKLWFIHPIDGLYQSDGTSGGTSSVAAGPKGTTIEPWQNRLMAAGDPAAPVTVYASAIADGTNWTITGTPPPAWTNDIREGNDYPIVKIAAASGIDIAGRPGCLVFKRDPHSTKGSTHRMNDGDTGAYTTVDTAVGAASEGSVVNLFGRTIVLSPQGIFWTDGVGALKAASLQVSPIFHPSALATDKIDLIAGGAVGDRCYFSLPTIGASANTLALEYQPLEGWIVQGSNAMSCYCSDGQTLWGGSPNVAGQTYRLLDGGSDDGADIDSYFQTAWFEPAGGFKIRFRRLSPLGRGSFDIDTRVDFSQGQGNIRPIGPQASPGAWSTPWDCPEL